MFATNTITDTFRCSIERAFKTPILGDATRILIAYGGFQLVKRFSKDETWGVAGGSRVPLGPDFLFYKSREHGIDEIFTREDYTYWKWGVRDFGLFFTNKAIGEWWCTDNNNGTVSIKWKYTWFASNVIMQPINWLYVKLFWRVVMKNGMKNIKHMAETGAPYIYNK